MSAVMNDEILRHRFTVDDYYKMVEAGLLAPDARVELIEGEIIDMVPVGSPHGGSVIQLTQLLVQAVADRAFVAAQSAVRLSIFSEPQPDFALLTPRPDFYKKSHAGPGDILLIIEVSQSSWRYDRKTKVPLYARHGIPEVWLLNLNDGQIHFFRSPKDGAYLDVSSTDVPGVVRPVALPGVQVDLSDVLTS